MTLPFAFEEPFFDREVYGYDMRYAKAMRDENKKRLLHNVQLGTQPQAPQTRKSDSRESV